MQLGKVEEQPANPPLEGLPTNSTMSVSQNQVSGHIIAQGQNLSLKEDVALTVIGMTTTVLLM